MAENTITSSQIIDIALQVDKQGNNNKFVDTTDEKSLFALELEGAGVSDAKNIIDNYVKNPEKYESIFEMNVDTPDEKPEYAIYLALNKKYSEIKRQVDAIVTDVEKSINHFLGFDDHDVIKDAVKSIDENNVLQVLNAKYSDDQTLVGALIENSNQEEIDEYGAIIIETLIEKAGAVGIDITHIVQKQNVNDETNKVYQVAGGIPGIKEGASATDIKYIEKVINALKNAIEDAIKLQNGDEVDMNTKDKMYFYATKADEDKNGKLEGNEIGTFKKLCAKTGILINKMLTAMNNKTADELTDDEKTLKQIFDNTSNFRKTFEDNAQTVSARSIAYTITDAIKKDEEEAINAIFTSKNINADNIEEILSALEKDEEFNNKIANKLFNKFDSSNAQKYISVILQALVDSATNKGLDVDDIVRCSNGKFYTGSQLGQVNKDATSKQYADSAIQKLRTRIKDGE